MRARLTCAALGFALALQQPAAVRSEDVRLASPALGRDVTYRALLPADYEASTQRYPVLYLLHGLDGGYADWSTKTKLPAHLAGRDLIVITPEGGNSWYVNWHDGTERWEDYLTKDLIADVDRRFRTDARRESRYIAGLSMGGFGALRMGLKHPQLFSFAGSLSGALNVTRLDTYGWTDALRSGFTRAFGPHGSEQRRDDDVFELAKRASPGGLPFFYIDCGSADPFLPGNRELAGILQERKIPYEFRETPGAHNWPYWDRQITEVLRLIGARAK